MVSFVFASVLSAMVLAVSAAPHVVEERANVARSAEYTGQATWFEVGLGACGIQSNDAQFVVAVSAQAYDTFPGYSGGNPNTNPICGQVLTATYQGKSVSATVVDRCVACSFYDLDFSPAAFSQLAPQSVGRLSGVEWVLY